MRLLVTGPKAFDDYQFVKRKLNYLTFQLTSLVLVTNSEPDREYNVNPSSFPIAERWLLDAFKRKKGFCGITRHIAPYSGKKKWDAGVKEMRRNMVEDADAVVAFLEVGGDDYHSQALVKLAKLLDKPVRRILL